MDPDLARRTAGGPDSRVPFDVVESAVWSIFEQTLGTSVRPWENLFKVGGSSIDALRITGRVAEDIGAKVALERFLLRPTVQDLARLVRDQQRADGGSGLANDDLAGQLPLLIPFSRVSVMLSLLPPAAQALVATVDPPDVPEDFLPASTADLLARYPAAVRRQLDESPVLAAYSVTADLAMEAAAGRERQGRPLRRLILLDPALEPHVRAVRLSDLLGLTPEDLQRNPDLLKVLDDIDEFRNLAADRRPAELLPPLLSALKPHVEVFARLQENFELHDSERTLLFRDYASFFRQMVAATQHPPPLISTPVTVVMSSQFEEEGGWPVLQRCHCFTGPVDLLRIPGDHFTVLLAPEAIELFATALGRPGVAEPTSGNLLRPSWLQA